MPSVPAFLADHVEPLFAKPALVTNIEPLAPQLRRIVFEGGALRNIRYVPGSEVEFRVNATSLRHYTPSAFDVTRGVMEVIFYLHGLGPGSAWAETLTQGSLVNVLGPGGGLSLNADSATHVFLGDETCIGLFAALARTVPKEARLIGAIEVEPAAERWPLLAGLPLDSVTRQDERGRALVDWLDRVALHLDHRTTVYVAGHSGSIVRLRKMLLDQWRLPRRCVRTKAYWADGKRGL